MGESLEALGSCTQFIWKATLDLALERPNMNRLRYRCCGPLERLTNYPSTAMLRAMQAALLKKHCTYYSLLLRPANQGYKTGKTIVDSIVDVITPPITTLAKGL